MREATCDACQSRLPMNQAFSAAGKSLCHPCLEQLIAEGGDEGVPADQISRQFDPTVCVHCEADNGDDDWPPLAGLPACTSCSEFLRNRPFPTWLKLSFAALLCLTVAAFVYNLRFFKAYVEIIEGGRALDAGNVPEGVALLESASNRVPEIPELAVLPNLYKAHELLAENNNEEALALVRKSRGHAPPEYADAFRLAELSAEMGIAFDRHDYDAFLAKAEEITADFPNEPMAVGSVASAYACKYATTGDPTFREKSLENLERAKALSGDNRKEFEEYENRILHRLNTREIITREEFQQRFPNGWQPENGG